MNLQNVRDQIALIRSGIRYHRAQVSDYRCWVDDERLYKLIDKTDKELPVVPNPQEFTKRCASFWENRQRVDEIGRGDPTVSSELAALTLPQFSDADLVELSPSELETHLSKLTLTIDRHREKGYHARTVTDDEDLYASLPEQVAWSSALPRREVFLANCARFCAHCQNNPGDLFEWARD